MATAGQAGFASWVLDSMSSGIVAIEADGRVALLNGGARRILGIPPEVADRALGRDCREVLAARPEVARLLLEARQRKSPLSRAELAIGPTAELPGRTLGFTLCAVHDPRERLRGAAMIFRDLAPIERSDEQQRLRERLAALGQMAAGLAHEIRNPLAGMEVLAGLLRRRLEDRPEERALVQELLGELRVAADAVSASLDYVRPITPVRVSVDPVRCVEEALAQARSRVAFAGRIERAWQAPPPRLVADEDQLRTVLTNLIVNAFEAMDGDPGARLRLAVWNGGLDSGVRDGEDGASAREVVITVGDNGPGIPGELREKVFYPFFTTKQRGSGVGLATAQKLVAGEGGRLELESLPGRGCSFHVRLPADAR